MGTRRGNLKSKLIHLVEYFLPRKSVPKFSDAIDYEEVFKNHETLMSAYGTVLKRDENAFDKFFRSLFVQSHIYKKLRALEKIYLIEITILCNSRNNKARSTLNNLIKDIDKFSSCLFYFPTIGWREIFIYLIPTIAAATAVVYHLRGLFSDSWGLGSNKNAYLTLLTALGLTFLLYIGFVALSYVEKRRFFVYPEYKVVS